MKVNKSLLTLMIALAAGSAVAVGSGTTAGTAIKNTAAASFTDPTAPGTPGTAVSNEVTTIVQPQANFDIQYTGSNSDGTNGDDSATNKIPTAYKGVVIPTATASGNQLISTYNVVNTGNINNYVVNLSADTTNSPFTGATTTYYLASDTTRSTPITSVTLPADDVNTTGTGNDEGLVQIVQVITVPATAAANQVYAVSPKGAAAASPLSSTDPAYYAAVTEPLADLQYAQATVYTPNITVKPPSGPFTPPTPPVFPPSVPPATPVYPDPNNPDPNNPKTSIAVIGNDQFAYPTADTNNNADVVTFNNLATNSGNQTDVVNLFPTGFTAFNSTTGIFTLPGGVTVRYLDNSGNALTIVNTGGTSYPTLTLGASGTPTSSVPFRTEVTYPDSNSVVDPSPIVISVNIDSGNDAGFVADSTTKDTIYPPAAQFSDSNGSSIGATNTTPEEFVFPADPAATPAVTTLATGAAPVPQTTAATGTDASAVFPMDVANLGEYDDAFTLSGTVSIPVINASTGVIANQTVNVRYVDSTGAALAAGATANTFVTPTIVANTEIKVFAIVDVPAGSQAGSALVTQNAVGNYSTISLSDSDDKVTIQSAKTANNGITVTKYQTTGTTLPTGVVGEKAAINALPGATLNYAIIAKNNFNAPVANFVLSDLPRAIALSTTNFYTYTTFVSASATLKSPNGTALTGTPYYRINGTGSFTTATPAGVTSGIQVAFDTNGDNAITATDVIPPLAEVRLDIKVTIK
ncbi:beta strand repeat-containing protein [Deinococcus alpinitundrae]|uniref:beta strand repeat-containing protein n=1 Tax=Deinococcus alpinitundrae TaxID=468913 RepID=UPI00137A6383|nr:hypothetical protein [Deinococcus alpinitundrae]